MFQHILGVSIKTRTVVIFLHEIEPQFGPNCNPLVATTLVLQRVRK